MGAMTTPLLFTPLQVGPLTVPNRAWVSPMCQYSVETRDGVPGDWHLVHYGALALGGWGLVTVEATGVSPEARISPWDVGLWNDEQAAAWRRVTGFAHGHDALIGVQLAHAGRKASTGRMWPGIPEGNAGAESFGWTPVGPTDAQVPSEGYTSAVSALDETGIGKVVDDFAAAARRATDGGFDIVEVHAAHGYLLHEFLSPLSNTRDDRWGGGFENRTRLVLDVVDAVRSTWNGPLLVRISASDWLDGGWDVEQSARLAALLRVHGVDLVDVSSGGLQNAPITIGPGYQVPFAEQVRRDGGVPTSAVGIITGPEQAEQVLQQGQADAVMLAREALRDPNWPLRAAHVLGVPDDRVRWAPARARGRWH